MPALTKTPSMPPMASRAAATAAFTSLSTDTSHTEAPARPISSGAAFTPSAPSRAPRPGRPGPPGAWRRRTRSRWCPPEMRTRRGGPAGAESRGQSPGQSRGPARPTTAIVRQAVPLATTTSWSACWRSSATEVTPSSCKVRRNCSTSRSMARRTPAGPAAARPYR